MKRSLAAVLAADVAGYSELLGRDTEGTLNALRHIRSEILKPTVASRRGRVVKSMGDGWIVLFKAASDAAACALQIQDLLAKEFSTSGKLPMQMRLGLHVGDVVEEEEDVFGDGVNVAARLEQIAAPAVSRFQMRFSGLWSGRCALLSTTRVSLNLRISPNRYAS